MTKNLPLVSIIVPLYNGEKFIGQCLQSLVGQRYPNKEIIVVDDGSTDSGADVVKAFGDEVIYIYQDNAGSAVARNTGIENAKGDFIAFNDGDDIWAPNRLHQQVAFLQAHTEYGVATGSFGHVDEHFLFSQAQPVDDSKMPEIVAERSGWVYHTLFETSWYHIIAALVRREILDKVRFVPRFRRGQDFDFWLQLAHHTQIAQLDTVYAYYRKNSDSISHKPHVRNYRVEIMENAVKTMGTASRSGESISKSELNKWFYKSWFEHGYELYLAKWYKSALKSFFNAMKYKPLRLGSYKFMLRCLLKMGQDKSP